MSAIGRWRVIGIKRKTTSKVVLRFLVARDRIDRDHDYLTLSLDCLFKRQILTLMDGIFPGLLLTGCPILLLYNSQFGELAQLVRATESYSAGPGFKSLIRHQILPSACLGALFLDGLLVRYIDDF